MFDGIGKILGLERGAWEDEEFRARLRVRIRVILADGTPESIIETLSLLADGTPIRLIESSPAELRVLLEAAVEKDVQQAVRQTALSLKPPGVGLWVESGSVHQEEEFAFDGADGADFNVGVLRGVFHG